MASADNGVMLYPDSDVSMFDFPCFICNLFLAGSVTFAKPEYCITDKANAENNFTDSPGAVAAWQQPIFGRGTR